MSIETSRRIAANDYGRGIGIFLVVLGHVLIGLDDHAILAESSFPRSLVFSRGAVAWIYAFHMPLFFFLSGLLAERLVRKPFGDVLSSRLGGIAWPYVLWSLLQESLRELTGISQGTAADWWRILYRPMMQFWFLYVLFFLSLAYYGLRRLGVPRIGVLIIAAVLHAGHLYTDVPIMGWVYHEFCKHGIYLAAGAVAAEWLERGTIRIADSVVVRLLAAAGGYGLIAACVARGWPVEPTVLAFVGIGASIGARERASNLPRGSVHRTVGVAIAPDLCRTHDRLGGGQDRALRYGVHDPLTHLLTQTAAGLYGPIALWEVCHSLGCDWIFTLRRPASAAPIGSASGERAQADAGVVPSPAQDRGSS